MVDDFNIEFHANGSAVSLDVASRSVSLKDGSVVEADGNDVGRRIAGTETEPFALVPWFWSDRW